MSSVGYKILRSSDVGAPVLSGQAGALIGVLDELLSIGDSGTYWQKVYTGTNKAAYRADNGDRYYLRVDDSNAQYGLVRGYATMSGVDTGTGDFPTTTQQTNYAWHKSNTANSTARTYLGIATDRFVLLLISGGWSGSGQDLYFFGDIKKANAADVGCSVLKAYPGTTLGTSGFVAGGNNSGPAFQCGSTYAAASNNTGQMLPFAKSADGTTAAAPGTYTGSQPNSNVSFATYGEILCLPCFAGSVVTTGLGKPRGTIPFVYFTLNYSTDANLAAGDTFTDADGRTYQIALPNGTNAASSSIPFVAIMTSDGETGQV